MGEGNPLTPRRRSRQSVQEIDMQQHHIHTQQPQDLPAAAWVAIAVVGIAYILALNFIPYWTLAATAAVLVPARFIAWLRSSR